MISETRFAKSYPSLWRSLTPTLELFVRKANLRLGDRTWVPLTSRVDPAKRAAINRIAFEVICMADAKMDDRADKEAFIQDHCNIQMAELKILGDNVMSVVEIDEVKELGRRMCINLFRMQHNPVKLTPRFSGCGIINACYGDAVTDRCRLIELKDGDRPFRSYDFRQLVIYAALALNEGRGVMKEFQIINSRRGISVTISTDTFSSEVAGQSAFDLFSEVVRSVTDQTIYQV